VNQSQNSRNRGKIIAWAALAVAGCNFPNGSEPDLIVSHHGVTYQFPQKHVSAKVIPPDGRLFVHLAPPETKFHLILDVWADRPSPHGPDVPRLSRLSDNRFNEIRVIHAAGGPVVCDLGPQPHLNCGIEIRDERVKWAVLFDKEQLKNVRQLRHNAERVIGSYRL
jgi:hypothetical protein